MASKTSTIPTVDGKYRVTVSPVNRDSIRLTVTNADNAVRSQVVVDIIQFAGALELATGPKSKSA